MESAKVCLVVLWHMHQPEYRHPRTGTPMLPWVRMHAAKDYVDMAALLEEYPNIKQNFNLTPVLLEQIRDLERGGCDELMRIAYLGGEGWGIDERKYLVRQCFMANPERQIKPFPRYQELRSKILESAEGADDAIRNMDIQDFKDLLTLFHLAWIDPRWFGKLPDLERLRRKESGYSFQDIERVIAIQIGIAKEVIPLYRRLADRGQIEISTSPYFHPIGPLLLRTEAAREANRNSPLPNERFSGEEDLRWQIENAQRLHEEIFGRPAAGIWPPECGVSRDQVDLFARMGFHWSMADQSVLSGTEIGSGANAPKTHYLTWHYGPGNTSHRLFMRDSILSDQIAFNYATWEPETAAADLVGRILDAGRDGCVGGHKPVVVIAMDGENAWENYANDGVGFLRSFYRLVSRERQICCCTAGEYAHNYPSAGSLTSLPAGSWINANFDVWMGHDSDIAAWDALGRARQAFNAARYRIGARARMEAWKWLMAAEGSDWAWWYGPEHESPEKPVFDELFRAHLAAVYEIIGERIPEELGRPLERGA